ncbi:putative adenosine amp deaminase protein [Echria macrotheca]|uniref:Adenosine amp deaminase protein n=1 Tax=Echria macrotheca TaxID=438768 RepID=A0AAJ0BM44_9PEZI|nr:putative adenosine amp deaminase protein [Echria macrotheca]
MGISCSSISTDADDASHRDAEASEITQQGAATTVFHQLRTQSPMADVRRRKLPRDKEADQYDLVKPLNEVAAKRLRDDPNAPRLRSKSKSPRLLPDGAAFETVEAYNEARSRVLRFEGALSFDHHCTVWASALEKEAGRILLLVRERDIKRIYEAAPPRRGYGGQMHPRFFGDHFLSNFDLIEQSDLFKIIRAMPKGAHLHIHFNANLLPNVLIDIAKGMDRMFITSDIPLIGGEHGDRDAFDRCKIQFSILSEAAVLEQGGERNLFEKDYEPRKPMPFKDFLREFAHRYRLAHTPSTNGDSPVESRPRVPDIDVDTWLRNKLVFDEEEAYNLLQTSNGAWDKFNGRTQMMKGLFNYETAYTKYTRLCLEEFAQDNIQYAEIRPNFMSTNQVWKDDGSDRIDNDGIIRLITTAYAEFQKGHKHKVLKGLKIIYCTPRSFDPEKVKAALSECLDFKIRYEEWIAGFDLVGEESKGRPLKDFTQEFLEFKRQCKEKKVDIPFLFHCGETLDIGEDTDGNLVDALLLGSKRIGHGFALPRHPYILEQMKKRGICVEVCPISNEILGLTPRMNGHAVYDLLAKNVHCTINTDNGTLFKSRLSHDFYQVMAGKADMTIHGLRQLAEWSIEHSCLEDDKKAAVRKDWEVMWGVFCKWIVDNYGHLANEEVDEAKEPNPLKL